jgi:hypothetical protein
MKRGITFSIALVMSIALVSVMRLDSTANASRQQRYVADTGLIPLGPNQLLRITVTPQAGGVVPTGSVTFTVDNVGYGTQGTCNGGVCKHFISSQTTSDPITLAPGEAVSVDTATGTSGQFTLTFNGQTTLPNVQVNALIIDTTTGAVVGYTGGVRVALADNSVR